MTLFDASVPVAPNTTNVSLVSGVVCSRGGRCAMAALRAGTRVEVWGNA